MTRVERGEAAMTWDEIGQALGFAAGSQARKSAFMIYKNAMRKIRNRPASVVKALRDLIAFLRYSFPIGIAEKSRGRGRKKFRQDPAEF